MPKLKKVSVQIKANDGEHYQMFGDLSVNDDGVFSLIVPEELEEICSSSSDKSARVERDRKYMKIKSSVRTACVDYLRARMKEYFNFEKTEELVIRYSFHTDYAICEDPVTNEFVPNGTFTSTDEYLWHGNLHATNSHQGGYSVMLYAEILTKTTYIRESSDKVVYEKARGLEKDSYSEKLDGFIGCALPDSYHQSKINEMSYTEEAAQFFYETLLGIAKVGHVLKQRFDNNDSVMKMIQQKQQLFIGSDNGN